MLADIVKEHQCEGSKSARDGVYLVSSKLLGNVWILKHIEYNKIHMAWIDECVHIIKFCPYCGEKMDGATDTNVGGKLKEGAEE